MASRERDVRRSKSRVSRTRSPSNLLIGVSIVARITFSIKRPANYGRREKAKTVTCSTYAMSKRGHKPTLIFAASKVAISYFSDRYIRERCLLAPFIVLAAFSRGRGEAIGRKRDVFPFVLIFSSMSYTTRRVVKRNPRALSSSNTRGVFLVEKRRKRRRIKNLRRSE